MDGESSVLREPEPDQWKYDKAARL